MRYGVYLAVSVLVLLLLIYGLRRAHAASPAKGGTWYTHRQLLDAIMQVEVGGQSDPGHAVGDHGKARGWYQIHPAYYADAAAFLLRDGIRVPPYEQATSDRMWSDLLVQGYMRRYRAVAWGTHDHDNPASLSAADAEVLARLHHGGPGGSDGDDAYWARVKKVLDKNVGASGVL